MATYTNLAKSDNSESFLLLENGDFLLQEDGVSKFLLEQSAGMVSLAKSAIASFTNLTKS